ncbi:hypothetical protein KKC59_04650 [bacterium]|nr:hypothetical protein [bacterium]
MAQETKTFHESWYRVAKERICLKSGVTARRQMFRGSRWYILTDPMNSQFFRLKPSAYEFISRLSMAKTVEKVWQESVKLNPDNAPGQEDVIHLLSQLYHANLLHYELSKDSSKLFERYKERKQKILKSTLMNILFFRLPLFDPDNFLKRIMFLIRAVISPVGAVVWSASVLWGLKLVIDHFAELGEQSQGILAPSNLFLLYTALVFVKALHEFGHSFAVRRFGGEVHTMGIMFLLFNPLPYMDATSAWSFQSKWKRVFVGAAGMITEVFVAVCAVFVWANTSPGVVHSLAYNIIFIASVSTLIFNINPLLRFDGYYILSDLLDIPNLHTQASLQLRYWVEKYAFACKDVFPATENKKEACWLTFFGIASGIYKIVVFSGILLFVADRFLLIGIIMAVIGCVTWVLTPIGRLIKYLAQEPRLERTRTRAISVCISAFAFVLFFFYLCPFPSSFKASGVLKAHEYLVVSNKTAGCVEKIIAVSGTRVKAGDPLLKLKNEELGFEIKETKARQKEFLVTRQKAMVESQADIKPVNSLISFVNEKLKQLYEDEKNLVVKAEIDGLWVSPELENYEKMWIGRGTPIGQIVNDDKFYFACVVQQKDASRIFTDEVKNYRVKLYGQLDISIPVEQCRIIPAEHTQLPSMALGWGAGGDVAINTKDPKGMTAAEPFYEVRADVSSNTKALLFHGASGKMRLKLHTEPLLRQWWRKFRQMVQKRYRL